MFGSQPAYPEKLLHKKESLQNQLINIRVELSQASTVTGSACMLSLAAGLSPPPTVIPFLPSCNKSKKGKPLGWLETQASQSPSLGAKQINPCGAELAHVPGAVSAPASVSGCPTLLCPVCRWHQALPRAQPGWGMAGLVPPHCHPLSSSGWVVLGAASSCFPGCSCGGQGFSQPGEKPAKDPLTPHLSPPQALANSTAEYESLESEVSALHDDLWEQLNLDIQVNGIPPAPGSPTSPVEVEPPPPVPSALCSPQRAASQVAAPCPALVWLWPWARAEGLRNRGHLGAIERVQPSTPCAAGAPSASPSPRRVPGGVEQWLRPIPRLHLPQLNVRRSHGSACGWGAAGLAAVGATLTTDFSPLQNEMLNRQIQKEIWRIQDVMEGLRKNNPSRGTDTAKHRGEQGPSLPLHSTNPSVPRLGASLVLCCYEADSNTCCGRWRPWYMHLFLLLSSVAFGPSGTYSSNSPASPLSSASLTSPLSPFSLVSGSQGSPTKPGPSEVSELGCP